MVGYSRIEMWYRHCAGLQHYILIVIGLLMAVLICSAVDGDKVPSYAFFLSFTR